MNTTIKILLIGAGGHCKSVLQGLKRGNAPLAGIIEKYSGMNGSVLGVPIVGSDDDLESLVDNGYRVLIAIGSTKSNDARKRMYDKISSLGYEFSSYVSDKAIVAEDVSIGVGTAVLDGAIINSGSKIGKNCIINSGCIIEHDCVIGNHVHVAPGVVMSGMVHVDDLAFVGVGAVVKHGVSVGESAIIGAGAVVVKDVPSGVTVVGPSAEILK